MPPVVGVHAAHFHVLELREFDGSDWRVFRWVAEAVASRQAFDHVVVVGLAEEHEGEARAAAAVGRDGARCRVETQRSLVQRLIMSPRLTTKASGGSTTSIQFPLPPSLEDSRHRSAGW